MLRMLVLINIVLVICFYTETFADEIIVRNPYNCNSISVDCVQTQFGIFETDSNYGDWSPPKGGVFFYGKDTLEFSDEHMFFVYFYVDFPMYHFYQQSQNSWAGLEIDILFPDRNNYSFPRINPKSVKGPAGTKPLRDTIFEINPLSLATRGITVVNPSAMNIGWNSFCFSLLDGNIIQALGYNERIQLNFQLVANIADRSFVETISHHNSFLWAKKQLFFWNRVYDVGTEIGDDVFKYFTMATAQQNTEDGKNGYPTKISPDTSGEGFVWVTRNKKDLAIESIAVNFFDIVVSQSQESIDSKLAAEYVEDIIVKISRSDFLIFFRNLVGSILGFNNAGGSEEANGNNPNNQEPPPEQEVINPGSPRRNGSPDLSILTMSVSKGGYSTRHHKIEQDPEETFYAYSKITNYGARAKDFKIKFYIDGGKKNFDRDDEDYQGSIRIDDFYSGAEIRYSKKLTVPEEPGEYYVYSCITSIDEDKNQSNNCSDEDDKETYAKLIVRQPVLDVDIEPVQFNLTDGLISTAEGEPYGLEVLLTNNGTDDPLNYIRTSYHIKGPGTNDQWLFLGDDGTKAENLSPGSQHWESIDDLNAPFSDGFYTVRACADYQNAETETDESNNCTEFEFYVAPSTQPVPTITVTNPDSSDEWRSDEEKHIEWTTTNLSLEDRVMIEYSLDGGQSWMLVDDTAVNDGGKFWDMCSFKTEDTDDAFIKITLIANPSIYDLSDEFTIDHAKECE